MTPEAQAGQHIDDRLKAAGWPIQDVKQLNLGAGPPVPLPPAEEQRAIAEVLEGQMQATKDQGEAVERSLQQSSAQRKNILRAAFSGPRVSQDPNDEPASALLERIRAERAARAPSAKAKKSKPSLTRSPPC